MAITTIKDCNGKEIQVDLNKIQDINGDIGVNGKTIADSVMKNRVARVQDIQYIDQAGQVLDSMQLIKDMQDGKVKVYALDVEMEATHSGKNHNYCIYKEDSMERDAESFMNPFHKPMLKNHNDYSGEPLGRIKQSYFGPSNLTDERSAIFLKTRVTDQDAIPKFLDGRYATVSIGGSMGKVTCNTCGKTILKDGKFKFCGHWRGEVYQDQVCFWSVEDIEYNEVSVVNNPADDFAQITKVTVITDKEGQDQHDFTQKGDSTMDDNAEKTADEKTTPATTQAKDSSDVRAKIFEAIDSILGVGAPAVTEENKVADGKEEEEVVKDSTKPEEKTLEDYKTEVETLNATITDLNAQLATANQTIADLTTEKENAITDAQAMKDQFIELAKANREMIIDNILEVEKVEDSKVDERKKELSGKSMKELTSALEDAKKVAPQRTMASIENPALANTNEKGAEIVDSKGNPVENTEKVQDNKNEKQTIDDYVNDIIGKLYK